MIKLVGKNVEVTKGMKEAAKDKFESAYKFLDDDQTITITVSARKDKFKMAVVTVYLGKVMKVEREVSDFYEGLDVLEEKLRVSLSKHKEKRDKQKHARDNVMNYEPVSVADILVDSRIVRYKPLELTSISEKEAIEQLEELGHSSFIFKNKDKEDHTCLLYKRFDGNYGLIDTV